MDRREKDRVEIGVSGLKAFLENPLHLARLLRQRKWSELLAIAELAGKDVDPAMAETDPMLYATLREAITLFNLKGYHVLDRRALDQMAREAASPLPPRPCLP